ncbi:MAG: diaminopimelate epimerase [Microlunatus sp.]|nr:diaminopimelate epimerase [Microlunatus sp.]MDN5771573.1 diaminopimelate epimerase [Microlunatus sp.]MDN5805180.1 diaminopimelate epimerase [Microlunatus sp.]
MRRWTFAKGHGTENDFVLLVDAGGERPLTAEQVRWICDRRAGIGADGVLRAVPGGQMPQWRGDPDVWFMDYRNGDGSIAEMCGNGVRVFVRHLLDSGLVVGPEVLVGTRAGVRETEVQPDGQVRVAMGPARVVVNGEVVVRTADERAFDAVAVDVGNPHAVSFCADPRVIDLSRPPTWHPEQAFPAGVNAEFVSRRGPRHLAMRVFERGVGETRSCGTGTVAAAAAWHARESSESGTEEPVHYRVDVPGGTVEVQLGATSYLTGPAVIVAHGELILPDALDAQ